MEGIGIYIISSGRPSNVKKMQSRHLPGLDVTWIVPLSQTDAYKSAGAMNVMTSGRCAPGQDLCRSRNLALQHAFDRNLICVQLSDDLNSMRWWTRNESDPLERKPMSIAVAIHIVLEQMKIANLYLGGGMPTNNSLWATASAKVGDRMKKIYTTCNFILGDFMVVRPTHLRFNERLSLKEDYEYTVQHVKEYGGVVRCFQVLTQWCHYTNKGGVTGYRTVEEEEVNIRLLKELHPGWFSGHRTGSKIQVTLRAPFPYRQRNLMAQKAKRSDESMSATASPKPSDTDSLVPIFVLSKKSGLTTSKRKLSVLCLEDNGMGL